MKKTRFSNSSRTNGFTLLGWIQSKKVVANEIKHSENAVNHKSYGNKSLIDSFIAILFAFLCKYAFAVMNSNLQNHFMIIFGLILMMLTFVIPLAFLGRAVVNASMQLVVNKKAIGVIALIISILTIFGCIFFWMWGLLLF